MNGHTPGPWSSSLPDVRGGFETESSDIESATQRVAIVQRRPASIEDWANMQLIAAAPDLLEALQDLLYLAGLALEDGPRRLDGFKQETPPPWDDTAPPVKVQVKKARAAIAKAQGLSL
jgi:hypothetical protein